MMFPSCISTDHQRVQLQIDPGGIPHRPPVDEVRDPSRLGGERLQRHVPRRDLLPPVGGPLWRSGGRMLHPGATLRREMGLSRDGEGRGGLQGMRFEPVHLRGGGAAGRAFQPLRRQTGVLPGHGAVQLPAVLRRRQRRAGLHRVPAGDLSLRQRQVGEKLLLPPRSPPVWSFLDFGNSLQNNLASFRSSGASYSHSCLSLTRRNAD